MNKKSTRNQNLDTLSKKLKPFIKTWNLGATPILVLNEDMAREKRFIC
jgi:hypothetical protein